MKKVYLLITAICLTALTGCIKEDVELTEANVSMSITTRLDLSSLSSKEQGDAIADINVWAFACNAQGEVSNAEDPAIAWRRITTANTHTSVDVHLQFTTCKDDQPRYYKLVAVINKEAFGTISGITTFDRNTTYKQLADATFEAPEGLMTMNPGHGPNSTPGQMPISHWTIIKLEANNDSDGDKNIDTHPGECYNVSMPVYRALAKTQLLVAKSDANSTVTIKNVTLGSSAYPTEGALLSAAAGTVKTDGTAGDLNPGNTPQWYVSSTSITTEDKSNNTTVDATDNEVDIFDPSTTNTGAVTAILTEEQHAAAKADGDYTKFTPITSYFLYENAVGSSAWNVEANGGYYMDVTYNTGEATDKTERVWLPAVVRNHDIQVRALVNAGGKMTLTINVMDWEPKANHWDFTDVVHVADGGQLKWIKGTEYDTNVNLDGNGGRTGEVECKFHIISPTGGTWVASLIGGDVNDFAFKVGDQLLPIVEGEISVEASAAATLTIVPKNPTVSSEKRVTLDIAVRTSDGRTIDASVVYGNAPRTIIQAKTGQ